MRYDYFFDIHTCEQCTITNLYKIIYTLMMSFFVKNIKLKKKNGIFIKKILIILISK